jgi:predicted RNase H-like nuclease (RuvC/YqgF family)
MPEKIRPIEQMLELSEEEPLSPEHLDSQVQKAQDQLLQLKRQQDQIEKQKRELEELSRKQEELERGRTDMSDKLTRSLVVLEREAYDAQKRLEQLRAMRESFGQHLELIEAIDPKSWNPADLHKELSRALSTVEGARVEFAQQRSRLQATGEGEEAEPLVNVEPVFSSAGRSVLQWIKIGFAFSLPLIVFGFIALFLFFWMASTGR